ncbi:MAG: hypothetical protein DMF91_15095 [Acidobacteria bacterium]|nr:MAG: hypothetical protein DMF91_15095 [Acidobacteriota bacterium]
MPLRVPAAPEAPAPRASAVGRPAARGDGGSIGGGDPGGAHRRRIADPADRGIRSRVASRAPRGAVGGDAAAASAGPAAAPPGGRPRELSVRAVRAGIGQVIDRFFASEKIVPTVVMDTENVEIIKAMVKTGVGISIVPYQAVAREVRSGQVFCARIEGRELVRETGWVYARANRVPRVTHELLKAFDAVRGRLPLAAPRRLRIHHRKR